MMDIELSNKLQHHIADLLWKAEDADAVQSIIKIYGKDAEVVLHMMVAATYDDVNSTELAVKALQKFRLSDEI
jgi:hypothetical protein